MSKLGIINKLIYLENVLCVYRNYFSMGVRMKRFVKLRILFEIATYLFVYQRFLRTSLRIFRTFDNINFYFLFSYNLFSIVNTMSAIILSVNSADYFKKFIACIDSVYNLNKDDELYHLSMKKLNKRFICVSSLSVIVATTLVSLYGSLIVENASNEIVIDLIFDVIFQLRYFFSSFSFYVLIELIVASTEYLNASMVEAVGKLNADVDEFLEVGGVLAEICYKLKKLNQTSRELATASACLRKCFGVQVKEVFISKHLIEKRTFNGYIWTLWFQWSLYANRTKCFLFQIAISLATDTLYYIILGYQGINLCIYKVSELCPYL